MEPLAIKVTHFFLQKQYIEPDQADWFQYGLARRMMGCLTFLLLLPLGAALSGWVGSFLYLYTFRFLRTRTGGYHAKTSHGCLLTSLCTMFFAMTLSKILYPPILAGLVLLAAALCILMLAPTNNALLHLTDHEIAAIRPKARLRLASTVLIGCLFLYIRSPLASYMAVSLLAVAIMMILANLGFGAQ